MLVAFLLSWKEWLWTKVLIGFRDVLLLLRAQGSPGSHPSPSPSPSHTLTRLTLHLNQPWLSLQVCGQIWALCLWPSFCHERNDCELKLLVWETCCCCWGPKAAQTAIHHHHPLIPLQDSHYYTRTSPCHPYRPGAKSEPVGLPSVTKGMIVNQSYWFERLCLWGHKAAQTAITITITITLSYTNTITRLTLHPNQPLPSLQV